MCKVSTPGPSAQQVKLMNEQQAALDRQEDALTAEKKRTQQEEVKVESAARRPGGASVSGLFGSRQGFGSVGGGSMFKPR